MPEASTLQFLFQLAKGIASQFGPNCEVVVHDLDSNDPESSIVAIENGQVTGRKVGDGPSHVVLETLRGDREKLQDHLCYLTKTKDGKILKSTTIYIRNDDGTPIGIFGINYDITLMLAMENMLRQFTATEKESREPEAISRNVSDLLDELIEQSVKLVGKPVALMHKEDKVKAIQFLNETGAFLITKLASILIGILAGYVIAYFLGIVDLSGVGSAAWVALPRPMPFDIQFVPAACVSLGIVYVVNAVQTIGDLSSTTMGGMDRMPTDKELSGGIVGQGVMSILGAFFGGLPAATYSQNVGIVTVNRVINRAVFALAALILLVAGLVPKFASLLTTIPQCVIGGATISVFATITMTGIRMITEGGFTPRKSSVVGLSVALGVGITQVSGCLAGEGFPAWVNTVFGSSSVVVAALMAILLNLILPKEPSANS